MSGMPKKKQFKWRSLESFLLGNLIGATWLRGGAEGVEARDVGELLLDTENSLDAMRKGIMHWDKSGLALQGGFWVFKRIIKRALLKMLEFWKVG